jgi:hypothetical protein
MYSCYSSWWQELRGIFRSQLLVKYSDLTEPLFLDKKRLKVVAVVSV